MFTKNALWTFGKTPFHRPRKPSVRIILFNASKVPEYLDWRPWLTIRPSACILTLTRSVGLATTYTTRDKCIFNGPLNQLDIMAQLPHASIPKQQKNKDHLWPCLPCLEVSISFKFCKKHQEGENGKERNNTTMNTSFSTKSNLKHKT